MYVWGIAPLLSVSPPSRRVGQTYFHLEVTAPERSRELVSDFKMGKTYCKTCRTKHHPPTGRKCMVVIYDDLVGGKDGCSNGGDDEAGKLDEAAGGVAANPPPTLERRMDKMEDMFTTMMSTMLGETPRRSRDRPRTDSKRRQSVRERLRLGRSLTTSRGRSPDRRREKIPLRSPSTPVSTSTRSRSRDPKERKEGKYDTTKYLPSKKDVVESYETLSRVNIKLAIDLYNDGEEMEGLLKHMLFLAEKAEVGCYAIENLVKYDSAVKVKADKEGMDVFSYGDTENINRHLGVDATIGVKLTTKRKGRVKGKGGPGVCYRWNESSCDNQSCPFRHVCRRCESATHRQPDCTRKDNKKSK